MKKLDLKKIDLKMIDMTKLSVRALRRKAMIRKDRPSLTFSFSITVILMILLAVIVAVVAVALLMLFDVLEEINSSTVIYVVLIMTGVTLLITTIFAVFAGKIPLKPVNRWINNMNRLAEGDFNVRMKFGKPFGNLPVFLEITDSFNKLAEELQNTEMLRSDFINNFSHEFKTPIVSIAGFAKLLKKGNLTEEQKMQYLDAIEEESIRLSTMATNVLNLTKVENQSILTDISDFNLSEHIRSAILLLESKWTRKELDIQIDFDEYMIEGNEELMKQIWINLLDNAVKFADNGGSVSVSIEEDGEYLRIAVGNTGSEIPEEASEKIWRKFYQADESHCAEGNGIGLAIVKRITDLHGGEISFKCQDGITVFFVDLPKKQ